MATFILEYDEGFSGISGPICKRAYFPLFISQILTFWFSPASQLMTLRVITVCVGRHPKASEFDELGKTKEPVFEIQISTFPTEVEMLCRFVLVLPDFVLFQDQINNGTLAQNPSEIAFVLLKGKISIFLQLAFVIQHRLSRWSVL